MQICRGPIVGSTLSMCLITFECISQSGPICKFKRPNKRNHSECKDKKRPSSDRIRSVQICQYPYQTVYLPIPTHNCKYKKIDELDFSFAVFCFALLCFCKLQRSTISVAYICVQIESNIEMSNRNCHVSQVTI